jgi:hypothetical protein
MGLMVVLVDTEPEVPEIAIHFSVVGEAGSEPLTDQFVPASNHGVWLDVVRFNVKGEPV